MSETFPSKRVGGTRGLVIAASAILVVACLLLAWAVRGAAVAGEWNREQQAFAEMDQIRGYLSRGSYTSPVRITFGGEVATTSLADVVSGGGSLELLAKGAVGVPAQTLRPDDVGVGTRLVTDVMSNAFGAEAGRDGGDFVSRMKASPGGLGVDSAIDPWGNPYQIALAPLRDVVLVSYRLKAPGGDRVALRAEEGMDTFVFSMGPNGKFDQGPDDDPETADDIGIWSSRAGWWFHAKNRYSSRVPVRNLEPDLVQLPLPPQTAPDSDASGSNSP